MRSEAMCEELRQRREARRLKHRRALNRKHSRAFRKRQKEKLAIMEPSHPTLTREEIRAVEEAMRLDVVLQASVQSAIQPTPKKPAPDCMAALAEFERRVGPHIQELTLQKFGTPEPEQKIKITPPFDYPNGIIR